MKSEVSLEAPIASDLSASKEAGSLVLNSAKMNCACRFIRDNSKGLDELSQDKAMM